MISAVAFQTKARTVDHLGREQIADTPTAISELWKNAFDAYARNVALDIYDGTEPVAVITDDGHGMNRGEFENRWLVVGTESKATAENTPISDRNGLFLRPRQGQKGIGRLSCANLGPILLLASKRRGQPFVVALIDWRLFENPFINLSDVQIPVAEVDHRNEILALLPTLVAELSSNVTGRQDDEARATRIRAAWEAYDLLYEEERAAGTTNKLRRPSEEIMEGISRVTFEDRHFSQWPLWSEDVEQGTALLVSRINFDLRVELDEVAADSSAKAAKDRFFETLSSFVDPFVEPAEAVNAAANLNFSYAVRAWNGDDRRLIVGSEKQFDRHQLEGLEHQLIGSVDPSGVFTGRVKAFGSWIAEPCVIEPPKDLEIPRRADTETGPFDVFIASMEFDSLNTTLERAQFQQYQELADRYSGFMIFRDGLRVLPYGRTDNDFFEIESRRSKHAGREFWNHRQMFGRLLIHRDANPNLKDKAGREGLLDNRAAKTLKELVANILRQSARRYFGSNSTIRGEVLPQVKASNKAERAAESRNKLRQRQRKEFRSKLMSFSTSLPSLTQEMEAFAQSLHLTDERQIAPAQQSFEEFKEKLEGFKLPGVPKSLGTLEEPYADYRDNIRTANTLAATIASTIEQQIEKINPTQPRSLLEKQLARNAAQIHHRIQVWKKAIDVLQRAEAERIREVVSERNKHFHAEATPLLARFDRGELTYPEASKALEWMKDEIDSANHDIFVPYIGALEALKESIDLEHLATFGMEELSDMRVELERLNSLAQLGIAVEIVGHELQAYDDIIGSGLQRLPEEIRSSKAAKDIEFGYDGLTDQLRFLSPLRLAGQRVQRWISGSEIADYLLEFFKLVLAKNKIDLEPTEAFRKIRIFDLQSRLYPVFINLINNSVYWTSTRTDGPRRIILALSGEDVVVSDNGPGVDAEDVPSLFSLFFTRKARGGRGVGLYLARANLAASGHKIRYESSYGDMALGGANFVISMRGIETDGE